MDTIGEGDEPGRSESSLILSQDTTIGVLALVNGEPLEQPGEIPRLTVGRLKFTWVDIFTMVIMGVIGLGVYQAKPAPSRSFPVTFQDGEVVYPQFAYPLRKEIVPIW